MHRSAALAASLLVAVAVAVASPGPLARLARADERAERAAARAPVPLDGIAAIVDDTFIFRSEVALRAQPFLVRLSETKDPVKRRAERAEIEKQTLARIIEEHLIARDAKVLAVQVADAEVAAAIDSIAKTNGLDRKRLEVEVKRSGLTVLDYEEEVRRQILEQRWLLVRAGRKIDRKQASDPAAFQAELWKHRELLVAELRARAFIEVR